MFFIIYIVKNIGYRTHIKIRITDTKVCHSCLHSSNSLCLFAIHLTKFCIVMQYSCYLQNRQRKLDAKIRGKFYLEMAD